MHQPCADKQRVLRCVEAMLRLPQSMCHRISHIGLQSQSSQSLQPHMLVFAYFIWFSFNVCFNHVVGQKYAFRITQRFTVCIPLELFGLQYKAETQWKDIVKGEFIISVHSFNAVISCWIWKYQKINFASVSKFFSITTESNF